MTTCRGCGALIQPEWDRCKICGSDGSEPEAEPVEGRAGRRARKARKAQRARPAPSAAPPSPTATATATATMEPPAPPPPPAFEPMTFEHLSGKPSAAAPRSTANAALRRSTSNSEAPVWLVGAALVAVIVGCLVIILKDPNDSPPPPSDVPAAESDLAAGAPEWESLGEWEQYTASGGGMTVDLPGGPMEEVERMSVPNLGRLDINRATVVTTGVTVTLAWAPIPEDVRNRPDLVLDGLVRAQVAEIQGEIAAQKDVTVDGMPALRARVTSPIGEVRLIAVAGSESMYLLQADAGAQSSLYLQRLVDTFES